LSPWSSLASSLDPVKSHRDHNKFYLCQRLFNGIIGSLDGALVHDGGDVNKLLAAAIRGQRSLFDFGFQSTHQAFIRMLSANSKLIDGRWDLERMGKPFSTPQGRYRLVSGQSDLITSLKEEILQVFIGVNDICTNYRLAKLLYLFKCRCTAYDDSKLVEGSSDLSWDNFNYFQGRDEGKVRADFESLFEGGADDSSKLDFPAMSRKSDLILALIDCIMCESPCHY
jgi:hypothetical protein